LVDKKYQKAGWIPLFSTSAKKYFSKKSFFYFKLRTNRTILVIYNKNRDFKAFFILLKAEDGYFEAKY
jgi:hypothetical protein